MYYRRIIFAALLIFVWWLVSRRSDSLQIFLATPMDTLRSLAYLFTHGAILDILASLGRVFAATALSLVLALPLALFMNDRANFRSLVSPIIDFIRYIPVPAIIPLGIIMFGIGESLKIAVLFIGTFFHLVIIIVDLLRAIPDEYHHLAAAYKFSAMQKLRMKLSAIAPEIWDALRVSVGLCFSYVIIAELVATKTGIGRILKEASRFSDAPKLFAALIISGLIGLGIDQGMKAIAPLLFRYNRTSL